MLDRREQCAICPVSCVDLGRKWGKGQLQLGQHEMVFGTGGLPLRSRIKVDGPRLATEVAIFTYERGLLRLGFRHHLPSPFGGGLGPVQFREERRDGGLFGLDEPRHWRHSILNEGWVGRQCQSRGTAFGRERRAFSCHRTRQP